MRQTTPLRTLLRNATHAQHVQLNRHALLCGLTRPNYPMARYRALICAYVHFYASVEREIESFLHHQPMFDYRHRRKLDWLLQDAQALHLYPMAPPHLPAAAIKVPVIDSCGALCGALYCLEGATLGGQVIAAHLGKQGLNERNGARFFHGYGQDSAQRWAEFEELLRNSDTDVATRDAAAATAAAIFYKLEEVLDEYDRRTA